MNNKIVIGTTFLSIFILLGVGYQPIIAEDSIEQITEVKASNEYINRIDELKELYNKCIYLKSQSYCNCLSNNNERLCAIFTILMITLYFPIIIMIDLLPEALGQLLFIITYPMYLITLKISDFWIYYECWQYIEP